MRARRHPAQAVILAVGLLAPAALLGPPSTQAQAQTAASPTAETTASAVDPAGPPTEGLPSTGAGQAVDPAAVAAIARELNCPLCQGYSLLDCPLQVCGQMRQLIAGRLAEGWTPDAVRAQFVADYGPQILSAPPASGWGLAAWLAPLFAALAGVAVLWLRRRAGGPLPDAAVGRTGPNGADAGRTPDMTGRPEAVGGPEATETPEADGTPEAHGTPEATGTPDAVLDAYRRQLEAMAREEA